uniref:Uncharacterized protein n=1 Tax=Anguilla anguilla TaxID=7936 RepID=A0A0E9XTT8_ANGAN
MPVCKAWCCMESGKEGVACHVKTKEQTTEGKSVCENSKLEYRTEEEP